MVTKDLYIKELHPEFSGCNFFIIVLTAPWVN